MATLEEVTINLKEAENISKELNATLSHIRVKVDKVNNSEVISAIQQIFGNQLLSDYGNVYITYDMYNTCLALIRDLGKLIGETTI